MNYRHEFHAGNFADVFKHIVLMRMIEHFKGKEKAFRYLDTHAGSGLYALPPEDKLDHRGNPPEWVRGIKLLDDWKPSAQVAELVAPYLDAVNQDQAESGERLYPGSPMIAYRAMRNQDRLTACELHEEAHRELKSNFKGNYQARILNLDGWLISGSQLPPKEKRGLLMIDPPFEKPGDFWYMCEATSDARKRWHGGTVALWYPLKHIRDVQGFKNELMARELSDLVSIELNIDAPTRPPKLYGCGMIVRHPPYKLLDELKLILPELCKVLGVSERNSGWSIKRLTDE